MTDDEKINAFEQHVRIRQLDIAKLLSNHFIHDAPDDPLSQSAFAILSIVTSYFEMIEQFYRGQSSQGRSQEFFRSGLRRVFSQVPETDAKRLYAFLRCGMYHSAMPTDRCGLSRELNEPLVNDSGVMLINPAMVVDRLLRYFNEYCIILRNSSLHMERQNMPRMFDLLATSAKTSTLTATQSQVTTTAPHGSVKTPVNANSIRKQNDLNS